jgi:hypothetical protein
VVETQGYYDRYTDENFWQQDASKLTGGDWLFFCLIAGVIAGVFLAFRRGDYARERQRAADNARLDAECERQIAEIYRGKRR